MDVVVHMEWLKGKELLREKDTSNGKLQEPFTFDSFLVKAFLLENNLFFYLFS
jgi:hypothetical protein